MALVVNKTKRQIAPRVVLYGEAGIGKSTFGAYAEKSIFINLEDGLDSIDADAFQVPNPEEPEKAFDVVKNQIKDLITEEHDFKTLVVDSLTKLEKIIWDKLCFDFRVKNIEQVDGGYARGYTHALNYWDNFLEMLDYLRKEKNMTIILLAHDGVVKVENPETQTYDTVVPRLHKKAVDKVVQWADCVFYAHKQIATRELKEGFNKTRVIAIEMGKDSRVVRTIGNAAVVAKNRYNLPEFLPLDYEAFKQELNNFYNNK